MYVDELREDRFFIHITESGMLIWALPALSGVGGAMSHCETFITFRIRMLEQFSCLPFIISQAKEYVVHLH